MKHSIFFLALLIQFLPSSAICQVDFNGKVIDTKTKKPIPYVNIGIVDEGIGTVSSEDGLFNLDLKPKHFVEENKILFSALGYETEYISVSSIKLEPKEFYEVSLKPTVLELEEVIVSNKIGRFVNDDIGYQNYGQKAYGYWKGNIALGGELATKIVARKGIRRLKHFNFEVWHNPSDSLLLRVNVYKDDGPAGKPGTNLNTSGKNIFCTVIKNDKMVGVDLTPYNIYVNGDFIVSLELLRVYGESELGLVLAASGYDENGSYAKYASQDKWEKTGQNMAYMLKTALMVSEKAADRYDRKEKRKKSRQQLVSGFVIFSGRMISGVKVLNDRTKEEVRTDENGRYQIPIENDDILSFSKNGFHSQHLQIKNKPIVNVILKQAE